MSSIYNEYCTGCGLCCACGMTSFQNDNKGFPYPQSISKEMESFCNEVCPMGPNGAVSPKKSVWGNYLSVFEGYASDENIRERASSGGALTAVCLWLLDNKKVDGIIHTGYNPQHPTETVTICSTTREEVIDHCGSRYSISSPLVNIKKMVEKNKKYAFVGKPCDVVALRNYMKIDKEIEKSVEYLFSFFCAGTPSRVANEELLRRMGSSVDTCCALSYRGNGWPGLTTAIDNDGTKHTMTYDTSWMEILGRDIRKSCKFCYDSIGEASDISCGDFWKLTKQKKPDFTEGKGQNCIFTWTEKGDELIKEIVGSHNLIAKVIEEENIKYSQPNHYARRSTMLGRVVALKIAGKKIPGYSKIAIIDAAKYAGIRKQLGYCKGTIMRIRKGTL